MSRLHYHGAFTVLAKANKNNIPAANVILYLEHPKAPMGGTAINNSKITDYKMYVQKLLGVIYTNKAQLE